MKLADYKNALLESLDLSQWTNISCWGTAGGPSYRDSVSVWTKGGEFNNIEVKSHTNILSLKSNLAIQVAYGMENNEDFKEVWANSFDNPFASSCFVDFFFNNQLIFRDIGVSVDGGRCMLPLPRLKYDNNYFVTSVYVEKEKCDFFRLLNPHIPMDYDNYIKRAKFEIIEQSWME
ncbi:TPA: hypothetical protein JLS61_001824 [Escherichia coli]|nr:hypothetical protein [Escherichia coli]